MTNPAHDPSSDEPQDTTSTDELHPDGVGATITEEPSTFEPEEADETAAP